MSIQIKRIYEPAAAEDGLRFLIDRLWPRGISKEKARLDDWLKDIAPSPTLRDWFCHKAEHFDRFSELYRQELDADPLKRQAVARLIEAGKQTDVTLLYGARDAAVNHAVVLLDFLREKMD
jgi:uncharacterized protein YeaO (DUF488 family)